MTSQLAVLSIVLASAPVAAAETWGFKWKAPEGCIEPAQLARAVEGHLGHPIFGAGARLRIDGELQRSASSPRWRARFTAVDAEGSILGSRELTDDGASCHALDDKLAVVVAVMIDPERRARAEAPPTPSPAPAPTPAPPRVLRAANPDAQEEYERRLIHFGDWVAVNSHNGNVVAAGSVMFQGKFMKAVSPVEFYKLIGEEDRVAELYASRNKKAALVIPGAVLMLGGLASMLGGGLIAGNCDYGAAQSEFDSCLERRNSIRSATLWGGVAAMGVGGVLALISIFIPYPTDPPEVVREKADTYNKHLRQELGLEAADPSEPVRAAPNPQARGMKLSPVLVPGGAGLTLSVTL